MGRTARLGRQGAVSWRGASDIPYQVVASRGGVIFRQQAVPNLLRMPRMIFVMDTKDRALADSVAADTARMAVFGQLIRLQIGPGLSHGETACSCDPSGTAPPGGRGASGSPFRAGRPSAQPTGPISGRSSAPGSAGHVRPGHQGTWSGSPGRRCAPRARGRSSGAACRAPRPATYACPAYASSTITLAFPCFLADVLTTAGTFMV